ncbi:mitochondrial substrate carrier family protein [Tieghemostelium lacteum]|uniref:Mitochondrial substrate carrier family protein n=1 Tax=Tieghemostelium lacteum TaxID=361077 RepID=A0A152A210_TIELA|nr:mitochondrial substrate carrier family protein [Tieghemostelium lacteum]|eukprot:KYR00278.1 mitochondrial substrate carrier family protein [Tieghemostelium lacteum]
MSTERGFKDSIAGTVSGAACLFTGHPFDTIRVRLQTSNTPVGIIDMFQKTVKYEGFKGLYKGVTSPLLGVMFETAILFTAYGQMKELLRGKHEKQDRIINCGISGGFAGLVASLFLTPIELVKCRLQVQTTGPQKYKGSWDCLVKTIQESGVKGIYKGYVPTMAREVVGNVAFFSCYESLKRYFTIRAAQKNPDKPATLSLPSLIMAGGISGMAYWTVLYPVDVAKSQIQTSETSQSVFKILGDTYKREGLKGWFRGYTPTIIRSFPTNAVMFSVYEIVIYLLG